MICVYVQYICICSYILVAGRDEEEDEALIESTSVCDVLSNIASKKIVLLK